MLTYARFEATFLIDSGAEVYTHLMCGAVDKSGWVFRISSNLFDADDEVAAA